MLKRALLCSALSTAAHLPCNAEAIDGFDESFRSLSPSMWHVAQYDFRHPSFDTNWRRTRVRIDHGLRLSLGPHVDGLNR